MGLNLESTISLNSAAFERGMHRVKESLADGVKEFVIGAIGVTAVSQAFERTVETAKELVNSAKRLDMTVEQVQLLRQAAKDAGQEFETVATAINKIDQARAKALGGDKKAMAAFGALGVNRQDLQTKTGTDLFTGKIAEAIKTNNIETITLPLREVLGRGASSAVAILKTDFNELGDKMRGMGAMMDGKVAAQLKMLADEFELVSRIIISQLAPALLAFAEWAYKIVLKGGGKIAGTSAAAGSLFGQLGFGKGMKFVLETDSAILMRKLFGGKMESQQDINSRYGYSPAETKKQEEAAAEPWKKSLDEFQASLDKAAKEIESPKPNFAKTEADAKKMAEKKERSPKEGDALIKVGNFLGSSKVAINNAQAMLQHTAVTASNTSQILSWLKNFKIQLPPSYSGNINNNGSMNKDIQWPGDN